MTRYADKIARIRAGSYRKGDYMIADAKDSDVTGGIMTTGARRDSDGRPLGPRSRPEFLQQIEQIVRQDAVDIMLTSAGNMAALREAGVFDGSAVQPAFRANETTCVWGNVRGADYAARPSRPYRGADLDFAPADLCLYSITFNNDTEADARALEAYAAFRREARAAGVRHFLEVFNPNVPGAVAPEQTGAFVTDCILRVLASLTPPERPEFLKVVYNGPDHMAALATHEPGMVVGVLGGAGATHRDTFELIAQSERHGARLALFGRKINQAEDQCALIAWMRRVADGEVSPSDAVRGYHADLARRGLQPDRALDDDLKITAESLHFDAACAPV
ncbi:hypothetical protein [Rhodovulum sulfidophilum]|uniref:Fructose-bisphosphate aldolase n=1 Tax=Rhodovulum sulfidophilum TaxID=35806 RepID=A0ABS1RTL3_RHOSU|nr:hypothetical protein [Rhodovulum sulfidophilum]MBL3609386.1 hypothetical protein [Rhodovulum sulfidophilum]MCE8457688.1 hypothetical protein [Rhodovulum sulfidophilum]